MTKPRLLHTTPSFLPAFGGQENCLLSVALRHAAAWDVHVLANLKSRAMHGDMYRVHHQWPLTARLVFGHRRWGRRYLFAQLACIQARYRFDVWDAHFTNPFGQVVAEYALRHGIPCAWSVHEYSCVKYVRAFLAQYGELVARAPRGSLLLVSGAKHIADQVNALGPLPAVYVPRGLDHRRFEAAPPARLTPRHALELVAVARNVPDKQLGLIVDAMRQLRERGHADIGLTVITHSLEGLREAVERFGLGAQVRLLRSQDLQRGERFCIPSSAIIGHLKAADCLVSMGLYEASPNVVPEAFGAGLPAIVADTAAHRELVRHDENGLLVGASDADDLAARIAELAADRKRLQRLAEAARRDGRQRDWDASAAGYADAYRQAIRAIREKAGSGA